MRNSASARVLNPGSTSCRLRRVRMKRPVPTSNTRDTATCTTTSDRAPTERERRPTDRAPPWNSGARSTRLARSAGPRPNRIAVPTETAIVKASTRASIGPSSTMVDPLTCLSATSRPRPQKASAVPSTAASPDRTRLSARSWRTMRARLAPRARRTAISDRRAAPRASSSVATFAQAASSTRPTSPIRMRSDSRCRRRLSFSPWPPASAASVGGSGIGRASAAGTTD